MHSLCPIDRANKLYNFFYIKIHFEKSIVFDTLFCHVLILGIQCPKQCSTFYRLTNSKVPRIYYCLAGGDALKIPVSSHGILLLAFLSKG